MNTDDNRFSLSNSSYGNRFNSLVNLNKKGFTTEHQLLRIREITQKLISKYEIAAQDLDRFAEPEVRKKADEYLNQVRVYANQLNHSFEMEKTHFDEGIESNHEEFSNLIDSKLKDLEDAALKFENVGINSLQEENKEYWENNYLVVQEEILPELETNSDAAKLVLQFSRSYSPTQLDRLSTILKSNFPEDQIIEDEAEYESRYLKALKEFKDEFREDKNLWDTVLDILAGGVHPSPNERVMLQKWVDGEQKLDGEGDL